MDNQGAFKIIAISGHKRSGKDVLADHFVSKYNYTKIKMADKLKQVLKLLFDFTDDQLESDIKETIDLSWMITPRKAMQFFGTEIMQEKIQELLPNIGRKFWVTNLINQIKNDNKNKYVISDLRFYHEYEELLKLAGDNLYVIRITRESCINEQPQHISELEYMTIPSTINIENTGSIEELLIKLDNSMTCN